MANNKKSVPGLGKYGLLFVLVGAVSQIPVLGVVASAWFLGKGRKMADEMLAMQQADTEGDYNPLPIWFFKGMRILPVVLLVASVLFTLLFAVLFTSLMSM